MICCLKVGNRHSAKQTERITKASKDGQRLGCEILHGLMGRAIKDFLFSNSDEQNKMATVEKEAASILALHNDYDSTNVQ